MTRISHNADLGGAAGSSGGSSSGSSGSLSRGFSSGSSAGLPAGSPAGPASGSPADPPGRSPDGPPTGRPVGACGESLVAEHRPWGYFQILSDEPNHKVKRLVIYPRQRLSEQRHRLRSEHWHVVSGEALLTLDGTERRLSAGSSADIPTGAWHRVANPGAADLVIIEIQRGESFAEEDIERGADDYGRS